MNVYCLQGGSLQCRKCGSDGIYSQDLLVCDECTDAYHSFCLNPPLQGVPYGTWRYHKCLARVSAIEF